jgi:glycerol-3-phosphate acyltransferase PlsY
LEQFSWTNTLLATVLAYALGSLSFAVIVSRVMRLPDPRTFGSGNPGATNVLRSGSKVAAVVTLLLDAMKGWLALARGPFRSG